VYVFIQEVSVQINARELRENLSNYLRLVKNGQEVEVTKHGEVIARLIPPQIKSLDIEALKDFHTSLNLSKTLPNAVLTEREDADS
jgi:prevent-host-death family protein